MVDEEHLTRLRLWEKPLGQRIVASIPLRLNYRITQDVRITVEGTENLPRDRRVIFALNHSDRYNYWPFQWRMWDMGGLPYTTAWVKAKYYENRLLGWFFDVCNNIPLPSMGYLILKDAQQVLERKLSDDEYRLLRNLADGKIDAEKTDAQTFESVRKVITTPRRDFDPQKQSYGAYMQDWNNQVMGLVERRSLEALFERNNNLIVFPTGTRSVRLIPGKTGLAEFALRHDVPVVPVGSNGSEKVYPGSSPWGKSGSIVYRIGKPMTLDDAFADCRISEVYHPFTASAEVHSEKFRHATAKIIDRIDDLLDEPYKMDRSAGASDARPRAARLM